MCFLGDISYRGTAGFKFKCLVNFIFHIPNTVVQKQSYPLPALLNVAAWTVCGITKQAVRAYLIFRQLYKYYLQRITSVSLEKKVLFRYFSNLKFILLLMSLHS